VDPRSILVVGDDPLLRELLASTLETRGFLVTSAGSPAEALRAFRALDPDGVVMDVDLGPGPNGFDLAEMLLRDETGVAIVFLTHLPDPRFAGRGRGELPAGVAYVRKTAIGNLDELVRTIDAAIAGAPGKARRDDLDPERPFGSLTSSQVEILRLVALGWTNPEIAERRGTTVRAVEDVVSRVFAAIGESTDARGNARTVTVRRFLEAAGRPMPVGEPGRTDGS
jgi:DNA-binding NarL/FixJ family response regulator